MSTPLNQEYFVHFFSRKIIALDLLTFSLILFHVSPEHFVAYDRMKENYE